MRLLSAFFEELFFVSLERVLGFPFQVVLLQLLFVSTLLVEIVRSTFKKGRHPNFRFVGLFIVEFSVRERVALLDDVGEDRVNSSIIINDIE